MQTERATGKGQRHGTRQSKEAGYSRSGSGSRLQVLSTETCGPSGAGGLGTKQRGRVSRGGGPGGRRRGAGVRQLGPVRAILSGRGPSGSRGRTSPSWWGTV